jgi:hypothetical protein
MLVAFAQQAFDDAALAVPAEPANDPRAASVVTAAPAAADLRHRCPDFLCIKPPLVCERATGPTDVAGRDATARIAGDRGEHIMKGP